MRRDAILESLAVRLANRADSAMLRDLSEMQRDMTAAADVIRDYIAVLPVTSSSALTQDRRTRAALGPADGRLCERHLGRRATQRIAPPRRVQVHPGRRRIEVIH
jgi:hypothetical protein